MADIDVLEGDGAIIVVATVAGQNSFDSDFLAYTADTVSVQLWPETDDQVDLDLGVDFTVAGLEQEAGFTITLIGAYAGVMAVDDKVLIFRETPIQRLFDYQNAGDFQAETVNRELDTIIMIAQELRRDVERASRVPIGSLPVTIYRAAANMIATYDVNGDLRGGVTLTEIQQAKDYAAIAIQLQPYLSQIAALAPLDDELIALAPFATQIGVVAPYATQVGIVGANIAAVDTVSTNIAAVLSVVANLAAINAAPAAALLAEYYATYAYNTDIPGTGGKRSAYHWSEVARLYAASINPAGLTFSVRGIGEYYMADTGETGVAIPPSAIVAGNTWVELTAGLTGVGQFNEGKLSGESVSGSAPNVTATANVAVAGPMNGVNIVLLNSERRFLRPGAPGTKEANQNLSHTHTGTAASAGAHTHPIVVQGGAGGAAGINAAGATSLNPGATQPTVSAGAHTHTLTINADGGTEARPNNIGVRIFRKVG